jgi:poly-gamma-glutamate synthesis protein (capsule biosynthesis protein)
MLLGTLFINQVRIPIDHKLHLLFTGDIFLDRHIDELSQKSKEKYAYPFTGLQTLHRENYDAWIGNLECPVTDEQSSPYEKENYLKFSCKKEYLPELKKYFDIVSLANNHTDNMNGRRGLEETKKHLDDVGLKHFGDFDNAKTENLCEIFYVYPRGSTGTEIPLAFCGYNGVFKLPKEEEIKIIQKYSKYFVTFVMPHQGEEYEPVANTYQRKIYHSFIDNGADAVIGSHPHVIQNIETYNGKKIYYSLGNFIFDQSWSKTREHMVVDINLNFPKYNYNYEKLNCQNISSEECLNLAEKLNIQKPTYNLSFQEIYTHADLDFITKAK